MAEVEIITATVDSLDKKSKDGSIWVKMAEMDGGLYPYPIEPCWPPGSWICFPDPGDTVEVIVPAGEDIVEVGHDVRYLGKRFDPEHPVPTEFKTNYGNRRGFKTAAGHMLIIDDKSGMIELTNGKSGDTITMTAAGNIDVEATTKVTVNAPSVVLGGTTSIQYVLKGTLFVANFITTFCTAWSTAIKDTTATPTDPNWIAYKAAMGTLIDALIAAATSWLSTTTTVV